MKKKTSKQWYKERDTDYVILDHDGWDRSNFEYSYNKEYITKEEYDKRLSYSTCKFFQRTRITHQDDLEKKLINKYLILAFDKNNDILTYFVESKEMDTPQITKFFEKNNLKDKIYTFSIITINDFENID